ncbi:polysaccharide pyruvyl transferase CsaB [Selenihalanaerobacter shriftii]|uniref:Polysaccharide pyruvyl transferase CsaB n=1 Tax=Selenihalanaerobacter shriftii TaxID=142842 RepID=A0A1T4KKN3_9FIRM|nr:polysaccharide pyruvyl transferase CsaB [Selenihalanaerobacter shriftii]SJZ42948.1 polysaccharide pyruvyl transferase CsaB [Selenihalanaerobacter shriftii]
MKQIAIVGYYGFDNAGDEAILASIISSLRERDSELQVTVLSANPAKTAQTYNVKAVNRFSFSDIINIFKEVDLFIIGGGSLLQDITSQKSILYYLGLIYIAKRIGLPVFFYGQGVGPVTRRLSKGLMPRVLNQVERITVRDEDSKELLLDLGVKKQVQVTADPVFDLRLPDEKEIEEIIHKEGMDLSGEVIGVSVRYWQENSNYLDKLAQVLNKVQEELNVNICFLPLHYPVDKRASQELAEKMGVEVQILEGNYHPQQIAGLFSKIDLLVGVRLHSLIFAAINQLPMVGISYDPKVDSFLERLDLKPAGYVDELNIDRLYNQILKSWEQKEELQHELAKKVVKLKELARENVELAFHLL